MKTAVPAIFTVEEWFVRMGVPVDLWWAGAFATEHPAINQHNTVLLGSGSLLELHSAQTIPRRTILVYM